MVSVQVVLCCAVWITTFLREWNTMDTIYTDETAARLIRCHLVNSLVDIVIVRQRRLIKCIEVNKF